MKKYTVGDLLNQLSVLRDENRGLKAAAAGAAVITEKALERLQRAQHVIEATQHHAYEDSALSLHSLANALKTYEENRPS